MAKIYPDYMYFLTLTVTAWVDVFTRANHKQTIVDSLNYCIKEKGLLVHAWVLMSNHIHLLASAKEGNHLSDILRDFKKYTSKAIVKNIQEEPESRREWILEQFAKAGRESSEVVKYKFWQEGNAPKEIHTKIK